MADLVLGIDEAGRGAQIGPLVVAAVAFDVDCLDVELARKLRDSKVVTASRREILATAIAGGAAWTGVTVRSAATVDRYVRSARLTLNDLERRMAAWLISRAPTCSRIVADGAHLFSRLKAQFPHLIALDHADEDHPAVMAAAVIAKVERDRLLDEIDTRCASLCGFVPRRGYPGPGMPEWIARHERFFGSPPPHLRQSWRSTSIR